MLCCRWGDQQLYAIMKNLKRKDLDIFEWLSPVPGDWHFIKTVSEVLKSVLWDGGFHDIAANCGTKEVLKWKDIHRILIALLEVLMNESNFKTLLRYGPS